MRILGIGSALVDILVQLPDDEVINILRLPKSSMQLIDKESIPSILNQINNFPQTMISGGSAANTIHGLACLGSSCSFFGKSGNDDLGDFYKRDLIHAGVSVNIIKTELITGRAYTFITPDNERTFATYLGAAAVLNPDDIDNAIFKDFQILHIEGYLLHNHDLILKAFQLARNNNLLISLDLASYNVVSSNMDFLSKYIPKYVDIVFANEEEARAFTSLPASEAVKKISEQCKIAVVKTGKKGSLIKTNSRLIRIPAFSSSVIDTTGAGDIYASGFLHGITQNLDYEICGKIGSFLASKVIENIGSRIPEFLWPDILVKVRNIMNRVL